MFDKKKVEAFITGLPTNERATVIDYAVKLVGQRKVTPEIIKWLSRSEQVSSAAIDLSQLVLENEADPENMSSLDRSELADQFVTFASTFLRIGRPVNTEALLAKVHAQAIELS